MGQSRVITIVRKGGSLLGWGIPICVGSPRVRRNLDRRLPLAYAMVRRIFTYVKKYEEMRPGLIAEGKDPFVWIGIIGAAIELSRRR